MGSHAALVEMEAQSSGAGREEVADARDDREQLLPAEQGVAEEAAPSRLTSLAASWVTTERATNASWLVNWALLVIKLAAYILSNSKAVLASLADSVVDLASQGLLAVAERLMKRHDARYPVGRARLEAFAVVACACVMCMAAVEVVQSSCADLYNGVRGNRPRLSIDAWMFVALGLGIATKAVLWVVCRAAAAKQRSDLLEALAEDHLNDVWSNAGAVVTGLIAARRSSAWWLDPVGGIAISVVIIMRWMHMTWDQVKKITGYTAPPEFIERVNALAVSHSHQLVLDVTRAYHFGSRFNVEMEIILPGDMTVAESHDIALALQHKIEELEEVERAFVHVDYQSRDAPEHKVERELLLADSASSVNPSLQQRGRSSRALSSSRDTLDSAAL